MYSCTYSHKNQEGSSLNVNSETSITSISNMKVSPPLLTKHETKSTYHNFSHIKNSSVSQSISPLYITETTDVNKSRSPHFHDSISPLNTGTKAAVKAPSPNNFRAIFGMAKASVKALCSIPAPIKRL
jgi:hypothetical protein